MKQLVLLGLLLLVLVSACAQNQLEPINNSDNIPVFIDDEYERPVINRTADPEEYDYPPGPEDEVIPPKTDGSVFLGTETGGTVLRIPLYTALGTNHPILGYEEVPFLRPAPIRTGDARIRSYRQFLRFDFDENSTGNVSFFVDESRDPEYVGTALFFAENQPIFEYTLLLNDRAFFDPTIVGSQLVLLGDTYKIMEATNFTVLFNGIDVPQYMRFSDGKKLETNHQRVSESEVTYDGLGLTYRLFAHDIDDDGILLREGESLAERYGNKMLALLGFDIRYDGLEPLDPDAFVDFTLKARDNRIDLKWVDALGEQRLSVLGISEEDVLIHGDGEHKLHFVECNNNRDACVREEDSFVLFGRLPDAQGVPGGLVSRVLRLTTIDTDEGKLIFRDKDGVRLSVDWDRSSQYQEAILPFLDREYHFWVINETFVVANTTTHNSSEINIPVGVAIDLDGDGSVLGDEVALYFDGGVRVSFDGLLTSQHSADTAYALNITFETGPHNRDQNSLDDGLLNKELLRVQAVWDGDQFFVEVPELDVSVDDAFLWQQELFADPDEEFATGVSTWGSVFMTDYIDSLDDPQLTDELRITMPLEQRFGLVSLLKQE
ncbi:hypothetical protein GOV10_01880 [Candidatus Woesearchaeota archaeon]|nr:hypothetical protein [Candidatus Woesearchaeota archaeon]